MGREVKQNVFITPAQIEAIIYLADTISAMIGCGDGDFDKEGQKYVKLADRFLHKNGYKRNFK